MDVDTVDTSIEFDAPMSDAAESSSEDLPQEDKDVQSKIAPAPTEEPATATEEPRKKQKIAVDIAERPPKAVKSGPAGIDQLRRSVLALQRRTWTASSAQHLQERQREYKDKKTSACSARKRSSSQQLQTTKAGSLRL